MKPERPLLIYDGDCYFCRGWVERCRQLTGDRVDYRSRQELEPILPSEIFKRSAKSVQLILPNGKEFEGAQAIFLLLDQGSAVHWPLWVYRNVPGAAWISEVVYEFVSKRRPFFSSLERSFGRLGKSSDFILVRWLLLKGIALIYFFAFASLIPQIRGLIGENGIIPAHSFLSNVAGQLGISRFWEVPTLCWINSSDPFFLSIAWGGVGLSLMLLYGILPGVSAFLLWLFYLSIITVGGDFFSFQWDALLLETGFLTLWLAPWRTRRAASEPVSPVIIWLFRLLVCRFIFFNGIVKVLSGDISWLQLTALNFHFYTQPLPTVLGWWAALAPEWIHRVTTFLVCGIEIIFPFLLFTGRRGRIVAASGIILLQFLILLTGNYGIFNWLTIVLAFSLFDDHFVLRWFPEISIFSIPQRARLISLRRQIFSCCAGILILVLTFYSMALSFGLGQSLPLLVRAPFSLVQSFELVNSYGAFSIMTKHRPEIMIEGSLDGIVWKEYLFKFKPGNVKKAPVSVAPFHPRLDWQMWFAALDAPAVPFWLENLLIRLLQNDKEVIALLASNPFPGEAPLYVRAQLYEYHFTNLKERKETGQWWKRERESIYIPPVTLSSEIK